MIEYRLISEPPADRDVEAAFEWYENERPGLGVEFLDELRASYNRIAARPLTYQELRGGIRRALLMRFPYAVYFAIEGGDRCRGRGAARESRSCGVAAPQRLTRRSIRRRVCAARLTRRCRLPAAAQRQDVSCASRPLLS